MRYRVSACQVAASSQGSCFENLLLLAPPAAAAAAAAAAVILILKARGGGGGEVHTRKQDIGKGLGTLNKYAAKHSFAAASASLGDLWLMMLRHSKVMASGRREAL
jgi:hypothetical protein